MEYSATHNNAVFELDDVGFAYDTPIVALEHLNLVVNPGESLAILGSNGSGKSTLLKILDGLFFPTSGSVRSFGRSLNEDVLRDDRFNFEFRRRVGFVFQDSEAQLFMPTVWEEVAFAPLQLGVDPDEVQQRVDQALQALQIEKLKDRAPHQLSGGEKRRVALASVLSLSPEVWLLDEPSAGLDPRSAAWLVGFINAQRQVGKTVVVATHDLSLVELTSDRIYVLSEEHRVMAEGTPQEILADHSLLVEFNLER
jgi:cobalt/nickel transport system ATP-binding protein